MPLHMLTSLWQKPKEMLCAYAARLLHIKLQGSFNSPNNSTISIEQLLDKERGVKITWIVVYFNTLFLHFYPSNPLTPNFSSLKLITECQNSPKTHILTGLSHKPSMPANRHTGHSLPSVYHKHPSDRHAYAEIYKCQMHLEVFCNTAEFLGTKVQLAQTARKILTAHTKRQRRNSGKSCFIIKTHLLTF